MGDCGWVFGGFQVSTSDQLVNFCGIQTQICPPPPHILLCSYHRIYIPSSIISSKTIAYQHWQSSHPISWSSINYLTLNQENDGDSPYHIHTHEITLNTNTTLLAYKPCPPSYLLLAGGLPANNSLFTGSLPANNSLFAGSLPANNLFQIIKLFTKLFVSYGCTSALIHYRRNVGRSHFLTSFR